MNIEELVNLGPTETIKYSFSEGRTAYFITNLGRVYSATFNIRQTQVGKRGYRELRTGKSMKTVHRMVASAFIDNPNNKPEVNHIDGNKINNNVSNLEWATRLENNNHAIRTGLTTPPKKNHNARYTKEQCETVVEAVKAGATYAAAGSIVGMPYSTVAHLMGRTRRMVNGLDEWNGRGMGWRKGKHGKDS